MKFHHQHLAILATTLLSASIASAQDHDHAAPAKQESSEHAHSEMSAMQTGPAISTITANVAPASGLKIGEPATFTLTLTTKAGQPIAPADLELAHTQKVHLLIVDPSLSDYHHEHPQPGEAPGTYTFTITPQKAGEYKLFADLLPTATGKQEYAATSFTVTGTPSPLLKSENRTATVDGYTFALKFEEEKFSAGHPHMAWVTVAGPDGKPFAQLEPVMGAYAHVVAFSEDRNELAHIHPMGEEPKADTDRGGPMMEFHTDFATGGYKQLFVQVQIGGKQIFAPFGVEVMPAKNKMDAHAMESERSGHEHAEGNEGIPETADAIMSEVDEHLEQLDELVASGKLDGVHEVAFSVRDMLLTLPAKTEGLTPENATALDSSLKKIKQQAGLLDKFGDAGDAAQTKAILSKFKAEIDTIKKLIPASGSSDAGSESAIKLANNALCPISGQAVGSMQAGAHVDYKGTRVGLCCMGCEAKFMSDPEANVKKALAQADGHAH
ncbi:hypothetical protein BH09SUM1_BH09SUM1_00820 [soil metagenome]